MSPDPPCPSSEGGLERIADELRALSNVTRLRLMAGLGDRPVVGESLVAATGLEPVPFPSLCHHVRVLMSAGLAESGGEFSTLGELRLAATARGRELTRSLVL